MGDVELKATMSEKDANALLALLLEESENKATEQTAHLVHRIIVGHDGEVEMIPSDMELLKVVRVLAELDTWEGMTRHMQAIHNYASDEEHEGNFPHSWADFKSDLARYIAYSD